MEPGRFPYFAHKKKREADGHKANQGEQATQTENANVSALTALSYRATDTFLLCSVTTNYRLLEIMRSTISRSYHIYLQT